MIGRQPAGWHHAVHVRMADQRLTPGVQNAQHSDLGAEVVRVGGHLPQGRRTGLKEPRVQLRGVTVRSGSKACGSVKTTCTYDTSSSSRSRACTQRSRACA